jgi:hypothetical protein
VQGFAHSKGIQDLVGIKRVPLDDEHSGFKILNMFKSSNWVLYWTTVLKFQMDHSAEECEIPWEA